ncbi:MAG: hypothetical protein WBY75_03230 [Terracidiphilus sp.]
MNRRAWAVLLCVLCAGAMPGLLQGQAKKTIIIQVRDGKTGEAVTPSNVQVLFNHRSDVHGDWIDQKDDGTIEVKVPNDAKVIAVRATYESSTEYYVNCDMAKQKDPTVASWYPLTDILASGISIPNDCVKPKDADKAKVDAKPGELIVFVRKQNWKEQMKQ